MKSALLVIDIQNSFKARPFWSEEGYATWCQAQQQLIDGCHGAGVPLIQIFHQSPDGGPFDPANGLVTTLPDIRLEPDLVIHKQKHSALAGTPLLAWLVGHGINQCLCIVKFLLKIVVGVLGRKVFPDALIRLIQAFAQLS